MAVVFKPNLDNEEDVNAPKSVSGTPSDSEDAGLAPGVSAPTNSGRFVNLSKYIDANKSYNEKGGGLAGSISSNLQNKSGGIERDLNAANSEFQQKSEAGRNPLNMAAVQNAVSNPTSTVNNEAALNEFRKAQSGSYAGPASLANDYLLKNTADQFKNEAAQTATESGRFNLLRDQFNKPTYSSGQQKLDNLFLQAAPGQQSTLQQSRAQANKLNQNVAKNVAQAQSTAAVRSQEAAATNAATQKALSDEVARQKAVLTDPTTGKLAVAQGIRNTQNKTLGEKIADPSKYSFDLLQSLGIDPNINIYGTAVPNLSKYLNPDVNPTLSLANIAEQSDIDRFKALSTLANNPDLAAFVPSELKSAPGIISPSRFNSAQLQEDLGNQQKAFEDAYNAIIQHPDFRNAMMYGKGDGVAGDYQSGNVRTDAKAIDDAINEMKRRQGDTGEYRKYIESGVTAGDKLYQLANQYGLNSQGKFQTLADYIRKAGIAPEAPVTADTGVDMSGRVRGSGARQ